MLCRKRLLRRFCPSPRRSRVHLSNVRISFFTRLEGQPDDHGWIEHEGIRFNVIGTRKQKGAFYIVCDDKGALTQSLWMGEQVTCGIDLARRVMASRLHTAAHVLMACAKREFPGYVAGGMQMYEDLTASTIRFALAADPGRRAPSILGTVPTRRLALTDRFGRVSSRTSMRPKVQEETCFVWILVFK